MDDEPEHAPKLQELKDALFPLRDYANGERLFKGMNIADLVDFLIRLNETADGVLHHIEVVLDERGEHTTPVYVKPGVTIKEVDLGVSVSGGERAKDDALLHMPEHVDVPVVQTCPRCRGKGYAPKRPAMSTLDPCSLCNGTGRATGAMREPFIPEDTPTIEGVEPLSETCRSCGAEYDTVYQVPNDVWAKITGRGDGGGLLCLACADATARRHGIVLFWEAGVGRFPTNRPDCEKTDVQLRTAIGMVCELCRRLNPHHAECESCAEIEALRASLSGERTGGNDGPG